MTKPGLCVVFLLAVGLAVSSSGQTVGEYDIVIKEITIFDGSLESNSRSDEVGESSTRGSSKAARM